MGETVAAILQTSTSNVLPGFESLCIRGVFRPAKLWHTQSSRGRAFCTLSTVT